MFFPQIENAVNLAEDEFCCGICTIFWNINALLEAFGIGIFMEYSLTTTSLRANARKVPAVKYHPPNPTCANTLLVS